MPERSSIGLRPRLARTIQIRPPIVLGPLAPHEVSRLTLVDDPSEAALAVDDSLGDVHGSLPARVIHVDAEAVRSGSAIPAVAFLLALEPSRTREGAFEIQPPRRGACAEGA